VSPRRAQAASAAGLLGPATCVVLLMLVLPLALLFRDSLNRFDTIQLMIETVTAANYRRFFAESYYWEVMRTTVLVASLVTVLCVALGLPLAWRLARTTSRWKSLWMLAVILPLFIGSTVRTLGWMILFSQKGVLDGVAALFGGHVDLMYTATAVVIGTLSVNLPFMVLTLQSVFEGIDVRLAEAAQGLGATPARAFRRIILPLALPGLSIATILSFILGMNAYATPVLLGGPRFKMMAPQVFTEFNTSGNWPFSAALAFILMATTLLLTTLSNVVIPRRYRA
jgi:putative spermidine/putrescine transport system permease protein